MLLTASSFTFSLQYLHFVGVYVHFDSYIFISFLGKLTTLCMNGKGIIYNSVYSPTINWIRKQRQKNIDGNISILNDTEELSRAFFSIYLLVTRASGAQNKNSVISKLASEANRFFNGRSGSDSLHLEQLKKLEGTQQERHYSPWKERLFPYPVGNHLFLPTRLHWKFLLFLEGEMRQT